jgi:outer membrane protein TolC
MKLARYIPRRSLVLLPVAALVCLACAQATAEPLTLKRAVQLALTHSTAMAQASADEQRVFASYQEARNQYVPQVVAGAGIGDSWGYPLSLEGSAPSLFNVSAQSALINPALRDFIRAARSEYDATRDANKDRRSQVIQDTILSYLELAKWERLTDHLREVQGDALKMEQIVNQRIQEGVDSAQTGTQARLTSARARLRVTQADGAADVLRSTLSQLTGIPAASLEIVPDSVPQLPETEPAPDLGTKTAQSSPAVLFAKEHATAQSFRARAEHRSLWPSVDFATQYAVLAKYNNWLDFFQNRAFERNNATVGVVIRFPFLNFSQRAHAQAADADALRATKEVENTKNQVSQEVLKLQRSVEQLKAAQDVSQLEYELAQSNVNAVEIRMNSGSAGIHDQADARTDLAEKFNSLEDAKFQLLRARIGLLRATGELESWAQQ